jgi:hypothetical protein
MQRSALSGLAATFSHLIVGEGTRVCSFKESHSVG